MVRFISSIVTAALCACASAGSWTTKSTAVAPRLNRALAVRGGDLTNFNLPSTALTVASVVHAAYAAEFLAFPTSVEGKWGVSSSTNHQMFGIAQLAIALILGESQNADVNHPLNLYC